MRPPVQGLNIHLRLAAFRPDISRGERDIQGDIEQKYFHISERIAVSLSRPTWPKTVKDAAVFLTPYGGSRGGERIPRYATLDKSFVIGVRKLVQVYPTDELSDDITVGIAENRQGPDQNPGGNKRSPVALIKNSLIEGDDHASAEDDPE